MSFGYVNTEIFVAIKALMAFSMSTFKVAKSAHKLLKRPENVARN